MKGPNVLSFLGGLLIGAGAAMLFAPEKGSETRKKIKETFNKEFDVLKDKISDLETRARVALDKALEEYDEIPVEDGDFAIQEEEGRTDHLS